MKVEDSFVNEVNSRIDMAVTVADESVTIAIYGPTSLVTNVLTPMEARRLRDLLNKAHLDPPAKGQSDCGAFIIDFDRRELVRK